MIKFITVADLLPLRNTILREGKLTLDECRFPSDNVAGNFHLGYYIKGELACAASFHPQAYGEFTGAGYQLRGMATAEKYQGQGIGNQLVNFAIVYLRGQKANYVWCNARKKAAKFYQNIGFEIISPEFDVPGIGPHYVMYVKIQ
jgi:GNAT superfamily N-acetyltransferase